MEISVISVCNLSKSFKYTSVLQGVSFSLGAGKIMGLVGPNGAGKTTLIRLLLGLLRPDGGSISVLDHTPWDHDAILYKQTGVILEHHGFNDNLTVRENLGIFGAARGMTIAQISRYFEEFWKETPLFSNEKKIKFLSRGQKMQCALCRAFLGWPRVCLFDEPTIALDIEANDHFTRLVLEAKKRGSALIISSHHLQLIEELCDSVAVLKNRTVEMLPSDSSNVRGQQWSIETDDIPKYKNIIESACGNCARWVDGRYMFEICDSAKIIPSLITTLANAGCAIRSVGRAKDDFKNALQEIIDK